MSVWVAASWAVTVGSLGFLAALIGVRWREQRRSRRNEGQTWRGSPGAEGEEFSMARYAPMANLLSEEDLHFLVSHPGYCPEIGAKFKRERKRIFRLYLRALTADFRRLHANARKAVANAGAEYAELVGVLMRQQLTFWRAIVMIELRLALGPLGGRVDMRGRVESLVRSMDAMRIDLTRFSAPHASHV